MDDTSNTVNTGDNPKAPFERRGVLRAAAAAAVVLAIAALVVFYHEGAREHARVQNTSRVRADQSGYLWDAVAIYNSRHGGPPTLIGERNRMPLYPWLLSWLYRPEMSPDQYFLLAREWNIRLSLILLAVMASIALRRLPPLVATNFVLVVAFGYYMFKAGYAQVELLFYFLLFVTFLIAWRLLRTEEVKRTLMLGVLGGVFAAFTHLAKAAMLPFVAVFLLVSGLRAVAPLVRRGRRSLEPRAAAWRAAAARAAGTIAFLVCFLGVLWPYLANSKAHFGHYFYNVNTTFYVWYDDWPAASIGTYRDGDGVGWPTTPPDRLPSMRKYLREHTTGQIARRFLSGFIEMVTVSYTRLWYMKYTVLYVLLGLLLLVTGRRAFARLARGQPAVVAFMALYALVYLASVAFYQPISGTSLRMLLAHLAPLLFVISALSATAPFRDVRWTIAGVAVTPTHAHLLILATIALDLVFVQWQRLMSQFAGY